MCCQTMDNFQSCEKNPYSGSIICEVASVCFGFEPVDICCKGFLFPLLNIHEMQGIVLDISIAQFEL